MKRTVIEHLLDLLLSFQLLTSHVYLRPVSGQLSPLLKIRLLQCVSCLGIRCKSAFLIEFSLLVLEKLARVMSCRFALAHLLRDCFLHVGRLIVVLLAKVLLIGDIIGVALW